MQFLIRNSLDSNFQIFFSKIKFKKYLLALHFYLIKKTYRSYLKYSMHSDVPLIVNKNSAIQEHLKWSMHFYFKMKHAFLF